MKSAFGGTPEINISETAPSSLLYLKKARIKRKILINNMADKGEFHTSTGIIESRRGPFIEGVNVVFNKVHKNPQGKKCGEKTGVVKTAFNNGRSAVVGCICGTSLTISK